MSSEPPKSCIENLPNELWVRIFTHIDWMNLLLAFYGLNKRINQLFLSTDVLSIYSSCLINRHDSIYLYFKEFPIKNFQYLRHLQLIYDNEFDESLNITKQLTSFSNLISLTVEANCGEYGGSNEFQVFILRQTFPCLQQLCLRGNVFGHDIGLSYAEFKSNFPSLRYLELDKLHVNFALQIFDDYPQLRSFSAKLYCNMTTDTIKSFDTFLPALKVLKLRGDFDFDNEFVHNFSNDFSHVVQIFIHLYLKLIVDLIGQDYFKKIGGRMR